MADFAEWLSRLFSPGGTHGLSGDISEVTSASPADAFYNQRMLLHRTEQDFVAEPAAFWSAKSGRGRRCGIRSHLLGARGDGVLGFVDLLLIVNQEDWHRVRDRGEQEWIQDVSRVLLGELDDFLDRHGLRLPFPSRAVGLRVLRDASSEMDGASLGLVGGEFVTGLLPNLYVGPQDSSAPIVAVHLNLPGAWEGYREVGRLYSDQLLFTIGSHWLDGFHHPALRETALYRLQQYEDGTLVHVIGPELRDRYTVTCQEEPGRPSVLEISDSGGEPVAWLVLAVLGTLTASAPPPEEAGAAPPPSGAAMAATPRAASRPDTVPPSTESMKGHHTIVPQVARGDVLTMRECGALLQKVHFSRFMLGYDIYVAPDGRIGTALRERAATFQVRDRQVRLLVHGDGVSIGGRPAPPGTPMLLSGTVRIGVGGQELVYRDLSGVDAPGWPYLGEIRRRASATHMLFGGSYHVGRDRGCKVALPDEPWNGNIAWREGISGETVQALSGMIPKSRFYTDSIMVASHHAEIDLCDRPVLRCLARHCYTFLRTGGKVVSLVPAGVTEGLHEVALRPGDEVLVGNCLFEVEFGDGDSRRMSAEELARAVDTGSGAPSAAPRPVAAAPPSPQDPPVAGGLGEPGPAPSPPRLEPEAVDSILGIEAPDLAQAPAGGFPGGTPPAAGAVIFVDESASQVELARRARLVQVGWTVSGRVTIGNALDDDAAVPELRWHRRQRFLRRAYFELKVRGRESIARLLDPTEARLLVGGRPQASTSDLGSALLEVVRRDADGEVDFMVRMRLQDGAGLPGPRSRLLAIEQDDPMTRALFVLGLPFRSKRMLRLGPIEASGSFDGEAVVIEGHLPSYRDGRGGFKPFFRAAGGGPFRTVQESGEPMRLRSGDRLIAGKLLYVVEVDRA